MRNLRANRPSVMLAVLVLPVTLVLSTTACTHKPDGPYYPDCPGLTTPTEDQAADLNDKLYETTTYTFVVVGNAQAWDEDSVFDRVQSPMWKATVTVGPWVRGSDQPGLSSAWDAVSNTGPMPLPSGPYAYTGMLTRGVGKYDLSHGGKHMCLDSQKAAYIFGTVTFEDATEFSKPLPEGYRRPDYPTSNEIQDVSLELVSGPDRAAIPDFFGCYEHRCGYSEKIREADELELPLIYSYSDENQEGGAGPRPFVIAVPDAFPSGTSKAPVLASVLRLTNTRQPLEQDGGQGLFSTEIPTKLGW